jgi:uncharacterized protein (DUF983 family)
VIGEEQAIVKPASAIAAGNSMVADWEIERGVAEGVGVRSKESAEGAMFAALARVVPQAVAVASAEEVVAVAVAAAVVVVVVVAAVVVDAGKKRSSFVYCRIGGKRRCVS